MVLAVCFGAAAIILGANAETVSGLIALVVKQATSIAVIAVFAAVIFSFDGQLLPDQPPGSPFTSGELRYKGLRLGHE